MNFNRMTRFPCLANKDFINILMNTLRLGRGVYLWYLFYHRARTESLNVTFFNSRQSVHTPCGMKSLSFSNFLSFKPRKTILKGLSYEIDFENVDEN
jgi:hypothetical protein